MLYHPNDNKLTLIIKHLTALAALFSMIALFIYVILDDVKIPQRDTTILIDVKDKVNICVPESDEFAEKSFFDF
jgi:hypothetical protein